MKLKVYFVVEIKLIRETEIFLADRTPINKKLHIYWTVETFSDIMMT